VACDEVRWWNEVFAAGYPDWMIKSKVEPPPEGARWVWTGRQLVPVPVELYEAWLKAHSEPVTLQGLVQLFNPVSEGLSDREIIAFCLETGLFVNWPWGHMDLWDTPEAVAIQSGPGQANPIPDVIPADMWPGVIRCDRLRTLWSEAYERGVKVGSLWSAIGHLVESRSAFLVAAPLPRYAP